LNSFENYFKIREKREKINLKDVPQGTNTTDFLSDKQTQQSVSSSSSPYITNFATVGVFCNAPTPPPVPPPALLEVNLGTFITAPTGGGPWWTTGLGTR
jgi:hypothetical protein